MAGASLALAETWLASTIARATRASRVLYWSWAIIREDAKPATKKVAPPTDIPRKKMPSFAGVGTLRCGWHPRAEASPSHPADLRHRDLVAAGGRDVELLGRLCDGLALVPRLHRAEVRAFLADVIDAPARHHFFQAGRPLGILIP